MKQTDSQNKMGSAPMLPLLLSMSLPVMFSMLIQSLYNIVDSMFVARLGETALTAVSLAYPLQNLILAVAVGTGVGLGSVISRRLGEKKEQAAGLAASHGLFLALLSGMVFALLGLFATPLFFAAFTSDVAVLAQGVDYARIVTVLSVGSIVHICMEKVIQATGDMVYPMVFQLVGAVTNIILDPIFIFGWLGLPAMGVRGAAIATVIGQMASMVLSLYVVFTKPHGVKVMLRGFTPHGQTMREIYAVALPSMVMQAIPSLLGSLLNGILIGFSGVAVSVFAIYNRVQSFVFMPIFGLGQGLMPIVGFNYGAKDKKRLLQALGWGLIITTGIMLSGTALFFLLPHQLLALFSSTAEMVEMGTTAFRTISPCFAIAGVGIVLSTVFQAVGKGNFSLLVTIIRQLAVVLPAALWLAANYGLAGFWWAIPLSEGVAVVVALLLFWRLYHMELAHLQPLEQGDSIQ